MVDDLMTPKEILEMCLALLAANADMREGGVGSLAQAGGGRSGRLFAFIRLWGLSRHDVQMNIT